MRALIGKALQRLDLTMGRAGSGHARIAPPDFEPWIVEIIERVQPYTYTSPERIAALCAAVEYLCAARIPGAFVECGVWKGGSTMAAMLAFLHCGDREREIWLYDTFEGMSAPSEADITFDGKVAADVFSEKRAAGEKWVYSPEEEVRRNIDTCGYPLERVHFVKGLVEQTVPDRAPACIALLRLDTDWYESTRHELHHLYPRLISRGVLIVDDYGHWQGARRAVDEYFRDVSQPVLLQRIDYTARLVLKP